MTGWTIVYCDDTVHIRSAGAGEAQEHSIRTEGLGRLRRSLGADHQKQDRGRHVRPEHGQDRIDLLVAHRHEHEIVAVIRSESPNRRDPGGFARAAACILDAHPGFGDLPEPAATSEDAHVVAGESQLGSIDEPMTPAPTTSTRTTPASSALAGACRTS